jgi:UDP-N-acetyl-2-amino-2-deoxyglucuronate dehydrogenase
VRNFAITGAGGYIAPRHLRAIRDTGNRLVAAADHKDSVLDGFDVRVVTDIERFERTLEKLGRGPEADRVHFLSVCVPNHRDDAHCRMGLRAGADVICEKPLVIDPRDLDALEALERETGGRIWTVLQLREHEKLVALKESLGTALYDKKHDVDVTYVTARDERYFRSWQGDAEKSGGVVTNIGIHYFDLLMWLFGGVERTELHLSEAKRASGFIELTRARVRRSLSGAVEDLPVALGKAMFREITVDGKAVDFSEGFTDLHTRVYERTLRGDGFGIETARASIELAHKVRTATVGGAHGAAACGGRARGGSERGSVQRAGAGGAGLRRRRRGRAVSGTGRSRAAAPLSRLAPRGKVQSTPWARRR